uniref:Spondin-like TSP1 domain-containing protein n=1 Tax=Eptatretus burgeri TaxID=7764 RepID=A0A8C4Q146_EPTBU
MGQVFSDRCPKSLRPVQEQLCLVPCPVDCVLTPFSEWTPCPEGCLPAGAVPQRQSRFAVLIRPASHGGRPCPQHLRDERECKTQSCPHYRWKAHRWQACRRATSPTATPREDLPCGHGLQLRDVSCRGGDGEMVEPHACLVLASLPPLSVSQPCRLPCPGVDRCSFSPWSPWSPCPPPPTCGMPSTRRRSLIGRSRRRDGCRDPRTFPLVESRPCPCVHPATRPVGKWSDCVLPPASPATLPLTSWVIPTQDCGPGVTYRALSCLDQEGRLLDPTFCGNAGYQEEACLVPCPSDCHLTIWSPWSACSVACGPGINYRSRWPRERSYNGGRPCPPMNSEGKVWWFYVKENGDSTRESSVCRMVHRDEIRHASSS